MISIIPPYLINTDSFWNDILPTLISVIVVVSIFIAGRCIDSKIRIKEKKLNWYFNVIVIPNIGKVDKFITKTSDITNQSLSKLIDAKTSKTQSEYLTLKSKEFGVFQKLKRQFEFDFVLLIKSGSFEIAKDLTECLNNIEDSITNVLDRDDLKKADFDEIEILIKEFKSDLYTILFRQIE